MQKLRFIRGLRGGMLANLGFFSKKRHGQIARNAIVLGFGTALSQALNILSTPVLSWYYSPETFGLMATTLSIVYIVASLANVNYDAAIVLPKDDEEALNLLFFCLICNIFCAVFCYLLASFCLNHFDLFNDVSFPFLPLFLSLGVFLLSTFNLLNQWAVRIEAYADSSTSHVIRTLCCIAIQLTGILFSSSVTWLIGGRVFGMAPAIGYLFQRQATIIHKLNPVRRLHSLVTTVKKFRRFPIFAAPQRIIALVAEELPTLVLAAFFGPSIAGHYWFSNRLLQMPCGVISQAIGRVFYRESAKKVHLDQAKFPGAIKIVIALSSVAILPVLMIAIWAPQIFELALGEQWQTAAFYSQWIVIWAFFRFSIAPIINLFTVLDQQKLLLKLDSFVFVVRILMIAYCALVLNAMAVVIMISIFESTKIALYGAIALRLAWMSDQRLLRMKTSIH